MEKIDFVITWVDSNDENWKKKYKKYSDEENIESDARFRDWNFLKYWFRSIEENAPWVNKIFFITEGHIPQWLNLDNENLIIIKHEDFIKKEYLPTFNSNVIQLNLYNIKKLSKHFVNFNDDMFLNNKVHPKDFFYNGLPKDIGVFSPIIPIGSKESIAVNILNNISIINENFNFRHILKKNLFKFYNLKYGKHILKNLVVLPWSVVLGFYDNHIPISYNKEVFKEAITIIESQLEETYGHRFRDKDDITDWIIRYWQLSLGHFHPRKTSFGRYYNLGPDIIKAIDDIKYKKSKVICLNDSGINSSNFEKTREILIDSLEDRYPEKSSFEK
ncbi:MAG: Stealth CR1 domain-containing protein [Lactobacillaceae bacterium]